MEHGFRLSLAEMEDLRQDMRDSSRWMRDELERRQNDGKRRFSQSRPVKMEHGAGIEPA